jgi:hypothetical protein
LMKSIPEWEFFKRILVYTQNYKKNQKLSLRVKQTIVDLCNY